MRKHLLLPIASYRCYPLCIRYSRSLFNSIYGYDCLLSTNDSLTITYRCRQFLAASKRERTTAIVRNNLFIIYSSVIQISIYYRYSAIYAKTMAAIKLVYEYRANSISICRISINHCHGPARYWNREHICICWDYRWRVIKNMPSRTVPLRIIKKGK